MKRRKMPHEPGQEYSRAAADTAVLLMNTYHDCCQRLRLSRMPNSDLAENMVSLTRFDSDFSGLTSEKAAACDENVEDNPDGKPSPSVSRRKRVWLRLAQLVLDRKYDPRMFIQAQFELWPPGRLMRYELPQPEAFLRPEAEQNYVTARQALAREIAVSFRLQRECFETEVAFRRGWMNSDEEAWADVLNSSDADISLSALFRYCLATSLASDPAVKDKARFERIAQRFLPAAALQYVYAADDYDAVYREWIPANFRDLATRLYRQLHGLDTEAEQRDDEAVND